MKNSLKGILCTWLCALLSIGICYFRFHQSRRDLDFLFFLVSASALTLIQLIGTLGYIIRNAFLLSLHLILSFFISIIISFFWTLEWSQLISKCDMEQIHFTGCDDCTCAATSTCHKEDFDTNELCEDCKAMPKDVCDKFDDDLTKIANHAICVVPLLMVIPMIFALIEVIDVMLRKYYKLMKMREKIRELESTRSNDMYDIDMAELKDMYEFLRAFGDASDKEMIKAIKLKLENINTKQEIDDRELNKTKSSDIESNVKEVEVRKSKKPSATATKQLKKSNKIIHSSQG